MPGFNRTGPEGRGAGTGRRMGSCFSAEYQGNQMGQGRGRRNRITRNFAPGQPDANQNRAEDILEIENSVLNLEKRMDEISGKLDLLIKSNVATEPKDPE